MSAHTNHSVVAIWKTCNKTMSIGLLGCVNDLSICGLGLPKSDVLHNRRCEQNWLLQRDKTEDPVKTGTLRMLRMKNFIRQTDYLHPFIPKTGVNKR